MAYILGLFHHTIRSRPLVNTRKHVSFIFADVHEGESQRKVEFGKRIKNIGWDIKFGKTFYLLTMIFKLFNFPFFNLNLTFVNKSHLIQSLSQWKPELSLTKLSLTTLSKIGNQNVAISVCTMN